MRIVGMLLAASAFCLGSQVNAQTIANAGFESPDLAPGAFEYNPVVAGNTFTGRSGITENNSAWGFVAAPEGTQLAFLQGFPGANGVIDLAVSGLTPGSVYTLSFFAAQRPNYALNPFDVFFNGALIGSYAVTNTTFTQFSSNPFLASGTNGTLTFSGSVTPGDSGVGIDDLALTAQAIPGAVPEPATWAMLLLGFGLVGGAMRSAKRRQKLTVSYA